MPEKTQPLIWIIDNNHWERALIRAALIGKGYDVEGFESIFDALFMLEREIVELPGLVVLDIMNLAWRPPELSELIRLKSPVILLTGVFETEGINVLHEWAAVMRRPFTIGQVIETVEHIRFNKSCKTS